MKLRIREATMHQKELAVVVSLVCLQGISLLRFSERDQLGVDPGAEPEPAGGVIYLIWPGSAGVRSPQTVDRKDIWNTLVCLLPP